MLLSLTLIKSEGAGKARRRLTPAARLLRKNAGGRYHRCSRNNRPSLRDGLHAYTQSAWCAGLLATIRDNALQRTARDTSIGVSARCDFTSTPSRSSAHPCRTRCGSIAAIAPRLACRDDRAQRPFRVRRDRRSRTRFLFFVKRHLPDGQLAARRDAGVSQDWAPRSAGMRRPEVAEMADVSFFMNPIRAQPDNLRQAAIRAADSQDRSPNGVRRCRIVHASCATVGSLNVESSSPAAPA